jgi:hypothetical protein
MRMFIGLMAIGVVISFLQIVTVGLAGIAGALGGAAICGYSFLCAYSLFHKIQDEF